MVLVLALKFLPNEATRDMQALACFRPEAQTASPLNYHSISTIYDILHRDPGRTIWADLMSNLGLGVCPDIPLKRLPFPAVVLDLLARQANRQHASSVLTLASVALSSSIVLSISASSRPR